jgi:hypothetical protein
MRSVGVDGQSENQYNFIAALIDHLSPVFRQTGVRVVLPYAFGFDC